MQKNTEFTDKLRSSGLRPTKQRLKICEALFNRDHTFHFTINDLAKNISDQLNEKISLATVYNTVHAFKKKGYLKEISINSDKSYFDTNITNHHHFFDEDTNELIDCDDQVIETPNIKKNILNAALKSFLQIRETGDIKKKPSTSELIDWLKLILSDDLTQEDLLNNKKNTLLPPLYGALLKNEADVELFQKIAFMSRRES